MLVQGGPITAESEQGAEEDLWRFITADFLTNENQTFQGKNPSEIIMSEGAEGHF